MGRPQRRTIRLGFAAAEKGNCRHGRPGYGRETEAWLKDDQHQLRLGAVRKVALWATEGRKSSAQLTVLPSIGHVSCLW